MNVMSLNVTAVALFVYFINLFQKFSLSYCLNNFFRITLRHTKEYTETN